MGESEIKAGIKGVCVVIFLASMGVDGWGADWWVAMLSLNVIAAL